VYISDGTKWINAQTGKGHSGKEKAEAVIARSEATPAYPNRGRRSNPPHFSEEGDCFAPGACLERSEGVARNDSRFYPFQHPVNVNLLRDGAVRRF